MDQKKIGHFIAEKRRAAGWTQSQLAGLEKELQNDQIRFRLGRPLRQLGHDLQKRTLLRLTIPVSLGLVMVWAAALAAGQRLNALWPAAARSILLKAAGGFTLCFFLLYAAYCCIVCGAGMRRLKREQGISAGQTPVSSDN